MSVLGTLVYLTGFPFVDRWGDRSDTALMKVHLATTATDRVHLEISASDGGTVLEQEVQLDIEQALELGAGLITWATLERKRQERAGRK